MSESTTRPTMRQVCGGVWQGLRQGAVPLVVYEILIKALVAGILGPVSAGVLAMLISFSGSVVVSNEQIVAFSLSLLGLVTLLVGGSLAFFITFLEQAGLMAIASTTYSGKPCTAMAGLWQAVRRGRDLLVLAVVQLGLYLACLLPFLLIAGAAYLALLSEYDINYYLAEKPPAFWRAVAVGAVVVVGLLLAWGWLYVRLMFALPACVLAEQRPIASLKASLRMTKGSVVRLATILVVWLLIVAVLGGILGAIVQLVERLAIGAAGQSLAWLIPTLAVLVTLNLLTAAVIALVGVTTNALLVVRLYHDASQERDDVGQPLASVSSATADAPRWVSARWLIVALVLLFVTGTAMTTYFLVDRIGIQDRVAVTAHRGSSQTAPENTLAAVEAAIRQGADYAEIDVQETADGVIVVFHDADLMRVTGVRKNIWDVTYDETKELDAGSWFSPEFKGEPIPSLQQVIDAARGRIRLNIEIKLNGHEEKLVERVVAIVAENDFHSQCVLSSLDDRSVLQAKQLDERLRVGHIVTVSIGNAAKLDVDFLSLNQEKVTSGYVQSLHRAGKEVHVWTVNDRQRMSALVDLGVDNIITDDPLALIAVLQERAEMSPAERILLGVRNWLAQ